jgi:hypothetical protein
MVVQLLDADKVDLRRLGLRKSLILLEVVKEWVRGFCNAPLRDWSPRCIALFTLPTGPAVRPQAHPSIQDNQTFEDIVWSQHHDAGLSVSPMGQLTAF